MEKLIKIQKIDIRMQSLNGHRMLKNASNELIFGPDMHFNEFYRFTAAFLRNFENCLIFGQKTPKICENLKIFKWPQNAEKCFKWAEIWTRHAFQWVLSILKRIFDEFWKLLDLRTKNMFFWVFFIHGCTKLQISPEPYIFSQNAFENRIAQSEIALEMACSGRP